MGCGTSNSVEVIIDHTKNKAPEKVNEQKKQINTVVHHNNYNKNEVNNNVSNNNFNRKEINVNYNTNNKNINSYNNNNYNTNLNSNKLGTREKFDEFFTTENKYYYIKTKKNLLLRFNKRKPNISLTFRVYNGENIENRDIKCRIIERKDFIDIHYIFKHKGKYITYLYANDKDRNNSYECIANYEFECEEEWGDENFEFPIESKELNNHSFEEKYEDFKFIECSVKNNVFNAGNSQKLNFKFKPDSHIIITDIKLYSVENEKSGDEIQNSIKYFIKDKNLDIDMIFNKKGKYKISINYFDKSLFDGTRENLQKCFKYINYYAIVESDAKEHKEFSAEEVLINQPFEDSLKLIDFKYISHKNQKISSKEAENFEFELESESDKMYRLSSDIYPKNTDSIKVELKKINNRYVFHCTFDEDIKYIIAFNINVFDKRISRIIYIISLSEYFKNTPAIRKNILETLDREKLKKLVLSCKKRTEISLNEFIEHFKDVTKNLTSAEKAYALYYWMGENIAYDVNGYLSGNADVEPESVYRNGYGVCSGYARLFKYIGTYIGLYVICVSGYAKGAGYSTEQKISGTNHEWNIIKLDHIFYQIDSTWGAGNLNGRIFQKEFTEFYFCPEPEELFESHFPED